jgi:hypothetical protein
VCTGVTGSTVFSTNTTDKLHERVSAPYGQTMADKVMKTVVVSQGKTRPSVS